MLVPIAQTLEALAAGELRSSDLVDSCLHAIMDPSGEGDADLHPRLLGQRASGSTRVRYPSYGGSTCGFANFYQRPV